MAKKLEELSLLDILPGSISVDANVQALAKAIGPELQSVSRDIREALIYSRIDELPEQVIDLLAWQFHVDFYEPGLPLEAKRRLVRDSIPWHRKKGTKWAVERALETLGFVPTIKEWFDPELGTPPHTFTVTGYYKNDPTNVDFLGPDTEAVLIRAIETAKPVREKLLHLIVAPLPLDLSDHICRWDVCTWEHAEAKEYQWGNFIGSELDNGESLFARRFERPFIVFNDILWDITRWEAMPYSPRETAHLSLTGIHSALGDDNEGSSLYPLIWDGSRWDYAMTFPTSFALSCVVNGIPCDSRLDDARLYFEVQKFTAILCGLYGWTGQRIWGNCATWEDVADDYGPCIKTSAFFALQFFGSSELGIGNLEKNDTDWGDFRAWNSAVTWEKASKVQFVESEIWKEEF